MAPPAPTAWLRVIQTTDVHGAFAADATHGRLPALAARLEREHAAKMPVLLIDSGDLWSGTLVGDQDEGATGVRAYNQLGYDAVALGNHEFDYGPRGPARVGSGAFGALVHRLSEMKFPMLAANLVDRERGHLPLWPNLRTSTLIDRGGFRIGLIGVVTEETPKITFPYVGAALEFTDATEAIVRESAALRHAGAELVFVLAHIGGSCGRHAHNPHAGRHDPRDTRRCEQDSPLFRLARGLPQGSVDALFGGHTHQTVAHLVAGIPVLQAPAHLNGLAVLDVTRVGGVPMLSFGATEALPPVDRPTEASIMMEALLATPVAKAAAIRREILGGRVLRTIGRDYRGGSAMGALVCDILMAQNPGHDLCIGNAGGLRADIPPGAVTYGHLYDALPFGNAPATVELSGRDLREWLRIGTSGAHGFIQIAGLALRVDRSSDPCPKDRNGDRFRDASDRDRLSSVTDRQGHALDPKRTYRVITNSFLARGGDGIRQLIERLPKGAVTVHHGKPPIRDQIAAWFRARRPILNGPDHPIAWRDRIQLKGLDGGVRCTGGGPPGGP